MLRMSEFSAMSHSISRPTVKSISGRNTNGRRAISPRPSTTFQLSTMVRNRFRTGRCERGASTHKGERCLNHRQTLCSLARSAAPAGAGAEVGMNYITNHSGSGASLRRPVVCCLPVSACDREGALHGPFHPSRRGHIAAGERLVTHHAAHRRSTP